jgi:lipoprotein-anchoring transpeptidase ErfK/SrfK
MTLRSLCCLLLLGAFPAISAMAQPVSYRLEASKAVLAESPDDGRIAILEKLNRSDARNLGRLEQLVVPSRWDAAELDYSPLPQRVTALASYPKAIVVDQVHQIFGAFEDGQLVRWGPVSSGRRTNPTPSGLFHLNWKSRGRHSTVNPAWYMEWYFNFHNRRGLALHKYALPGRPASHACIRLLERDARWIYEWGDGWTLDARERVIENGTPLWIIGDFDFDAPSPWLDARDPHPQVAVELTAE